MGVPISSTSNHGPNAELPILSPGRNSENAGLREPPLNELSSEELSNFWNLSWLIRETIGSTRSSSTTGPRAFSGFSPLLFGSDPGLASLVSDLGDAFTLASWDVPQGNESVRRRGGESRQIPRPRIVVFPDTDYNRHSKRAKKRINAGGDPHPNSPKELQKLECCICMTTWHRPVFASCLHVYCVQCICRWLSERSACPLCRAPLYSSQLRLLTTVTHRDSLYLVKLAKRHAQLIVDCPKCLRRTSMSDWEESCGKGRCPQKTERSALTETTTTASSSSEIVVNNTEITNDSLANWLVENPPGTAVRLYIITHRMENTAGAIGGLILDGLKHTQAVVEFDLNPTSIAATEETPPLMWENRSTEQDIITTDSCETESSKTFLSMEIFADKPGVVWSISQCMPYFRSTAERLLVYKDLRVPSEDIVDFIVRTRGRKYNLLSWNCHTFTKLLRGTMKVNGVPQCVEIPAPMSDSKDLTRVLDQILIEGDIPCLRSTNPMTASQETFISPVPGSSLTSSLIEWLQKLPRQRNGSSSSTSVALPPHSSSEWRMPSPPEVRVGQMCLVLYDAEDLHRRSLHGVAQFNRLDGMSSEEIYIRHYYLPVLLCRIQSRKILKTISRRCNSAQKVWHDVAWISAEFRSDRGLVWHMYKERPRGIHMGQEAISTMTDFPLQRLIDALEKHNTRSYNSRSWGAWEWTDAVCQDCAPGLLATMAESIRL